MIHPETFWEHSSDFSLRVPLEEHLHVKDAQYKCHSNLPAVCSVYFLVYNGKEQLQWTTGNIRAHPQGTSNMHSKVHDQSGQQLVTQFVAQLTWSRGVDQCQTKSYTALYVQDNQGVEQSSGGTRKMNKKKMYLILNKRGAENI